MSHRLGDEVTVGNLYGKRVHAHEVHTKQVPHVNGVSLLDMVEREVLEPKLEQLKQDLGIPETQSTDATLAARVLALEQRLNLLTGVGDQLTQVGNTLSAAFGQNPP